MDIKRLGNPGGKSVMLLHGNLMCWRQFEDLIPYLEPDYCIHAVSFDGFDGTGQTTYTTAQAQADRLAEYLDFGVLNRLILKVMPSKQYKTAHEKSMPAWALRFMGQTEEREGHMKKALLLESLRVRKKGGVFVLHDNMKRQMYGDMGAFVQKLQDMGFAKAVYMETAADIFGSKGRAARMMLGDSAMIVGKK